MKPRETPPAPIDQALAYSIPHAAQITGLGKTSIYRLVNEGQLQLRKVGTRSLITASSLRAFIECEAA